MRKYVVPAILHKRSDIVEWQPMPWWGMDSFIGFRLFCLGCVALVFGKRNGRSWPGLFMLLTAACLALRSRRHAPFFGITALAFAGRVESVFRQVASKLTGGFAERSCDELCLLPMRSWRLS
jgi:hypothetical protein